MGRLVGTHPVLVRTAVAALVGMAVTVSVVLVDSLRFAYRSPDGRLVIETVAALVAAITATLFYGRFRRCGSLQSLLLVHSLGLFAVAALGLVVLPIVGGLDDDSALTTWAPLVVRLVAALLLGAAALVPHRSVRPRPLWKDVAVAAALMALVVGAVAVLAGSLPVAVDTLPPPEQSRVPRFDGHPVVLVAQGVALAGYALASVAFTRQARSTDDDLAGWIGAAAALGAWARVNYLMYPSLYSEWLYVGDLLRLAFYVLLLVGALREVQGYWAAQRQVAVEVERRRLARELHDGVMQEIGYIRNEARQVPGRSGQRLVSAAERALDEARSAVAALVAPADQSLSDVLRRSVTEVADRHGVRIVWDLEDPSTAAAEHRHDLVRIAREAVTNAARHGGARCVSVRLRCGELLLEDDGTGFDPKAAIRPGAFGLMGMRDRAEGMSGVLAVSSRPGAGTTVKVTW